MVRWPMIPSSQQRLIDVERGERLAGPRILQARNPESRDSGLGNLHAVQRGRNVGDLRVDLRVIDAVPAADHGLAVRHRRPGKAHARGDIVQVGMQRNRLALNVVPDACAEQKIGRHLPRILQEEAHALEPGLPVRIAETLLIQGGQPQVVGLQRGKWLAQGGDQALLPKCREGGNQGVGGIGIARELGQQKP